MKKISKHLIMMLCACLLIILSVPHVARAAENPQQWVFDSAGLMTVEEIEEMEQRIHSLRKKVNNDFVIVTANNVPYNQTVAFADDYYDQNGFGIGDEKNGVLFLVDLNNRQIYISTSGEMIKILTDERIDKILDIVSPYASNELYGGAANAFLDEVEQINDELMASGDYAVNEKTGRIEVVRRITGMELFSSLIGALTVAVIPAIIIRMRYRMKKGKIAQKDQGYRLGAAFAYTVDEADLTDTRVIQRRIPRQTIHSSGSSGSGRMRGFGGSSSTHRSSSGRSHGGGGRRF